MSKSRVVIELMLDALVEHEAITPRVAMRLLAACDAYIAEELKQRSGQPEVPRQGWAECPD